MSSSGPPASPATRGAGPAPRRLAGRWASLAGALRLVLDLLGASAERLAAAVDGIRRAWAASLAEQGPSIRQIGERLGGQPPTGLRTPQVASQPQPGDPMTPSPRDVDGSGGQPVRRAGYGVILAICLPRDKLSVPVLRHLVRYALDQVGVLDAISSDIEIALTEAALVGGALRSSISAA